MRPQLYRQRLHRTREPKPVARPRYVCTVRLQQLAPLPIYPHTLPDTQPGTRHEQTPLAVHAAESDSHCQVLQTAVKSCRLLLALELAQLEALERPGLHENYSSYIALQHAPGDRRREAPGCCLWNIRHPSLQPRSVWDYGPCSSMQTLMPISSTHQSDYKVKTAAICSGPASLHSTLFLRSATLNSALTSHTLPSSHITCTDS